MMMEITDRIYSVTPGEGNRPVPILSDEYFEELPNPGKFLYGKGGFRDPRIGEKN